MQASGTCDVCVQKAGPASRLSRQLCSKVTSKTIATQTKCHWHTETLCSQLPFSRIILSVTQLEVRAFKLEKWLERFVLPGDFMP